jgi:hypothetical protein
MNGKSAQRQIPSLGVIKQQLRTLRDRMPCDVFGIKVTRWPDWSRRPYEIGTWGRRPGFSEHAAATIISEMLKGKSYHRAADDFFNRQRTKNN